MDQALRVESRWFAKILRSPEAAAMIRSLFVSMQELNKGARRPKSVPATKLKTIGVLGAGFMGAGIAYVTAQAGLDVVLIDRDQASAEKGKAHSEKLMSEQVNRGRATAAEAEKLRRELDRLSSTLDLVESERDKAGRPLYTSDKKDMDGKKCELVSREVNVVPAQKPVPPSEVSRRGGFPKESASDRAFAKGRQRNILEQELTTEEGLLVLEQRGVRRDLVVGAMLGAFGQLS